jgi:hypothetical protein
MGLLGGLFGGGDSKKGGGGGGGILDSIANVASVFSPTTAFLQGEKASGAFATADSVVQSPLGQLAGDLIGKLPMGDLALQIADVGYSSAKAASQLGGKEGGASLFAGLFD